MPLRLYNLLACLLECLDKEALVCHNRFLPQWLDNKAPVIRIHSRLRLDHMSSWLDGGLRRNKWIYKTD